MRRGTVAVGLGLVVLWAAVTNGQYGQEGLPFNQPGPGYTVKPSPYPSPTHRGRVENAEPLPAPAIAEAIDEFVPKWFGIVVAASDEGWYGVESCLSHRSQLVMKGKPGYEVGSAVFFNARKEIVCGGKLLKRIRYFGTPNSVQYNVNDTIEDLFATPPGPDDATQPNPT